MRLPDFLQWEELNDLRRRMGHVPLGRLKLASDNDLLTEDELERLVHEGVDLQSLNELKVLADGTLSYKNARVLLYIRDVASYGGYRRNRDDLPRFHIANCTTLQEMRERNRFERYVVAARTDGIFRIARIDGQRRRESDERLRVCQNCLGRLAFDGFDNAWDRARRVRAVKAFTTERFFSLYPRDILVHKPTHDSNSAPPNVYPEDFDELARLTKERRGWKCERCTRDFSERRYRRFLHVHHENGQKYDCRPDNLRVLCLGCHADQPGHGHMKSLPEYGEFCRLFGS